jgi:hypothetical protein
VSAVALASRYDLWAEGRREEKKFKKKLDFKKERAIVKKEVRV